MKKTIMTCDCCGKEFYSEYYTGGYIDHTNLSNNFDVLFRCGAKRIISEICKHGNSLRDADDVKIRLNCFHEYCKKLLVTKLYDEVKEGVDKYIERTRELDLLHDKIVDIVKDLDEFEREYIGLEYQAFMSKSQRK